MNKQQLTTVLQSTLFKFDGLTKDDILKLNPEYDLELIKIGIRLNGFLDRRIK